MDRLTAAAVTFGPALVLVAGCVWMVVREPGSVPRRPWFYRGRRRAPAWWRRRRQQPGGHVGVTLDSPPLASLMPDGVLDGPTLTLADLAADAEVIVDHLHRDEDAVSAEVRAAFDAVWVVVEDKMILARMACAGVEARLLASAGVPRRRATWDEATSRWNTRELRALLDRDGLAVAR
jgi:hypothetical protein